MAPSEMTIFQLVELMRRDKAAALKEMTLRFRRAAKEASERSRALGLPVCDGRPGEPLPPEENWEGIPAAQRRPNKPVSIEDMHQAVLDQAVDDDARSKQS
jgi:hypothetical protein